MIDLPLEPTGPAYLALLREAAVACESFSLVWRDLPRQSDGPAAIEKALRPALLQEGSARSWPGTELLGGPPATVRHYRLDPSTLGLLSQAPGLYAWLAPDRPEDLAFYRANGSVWLGSVAHEAMGFFGDGAPSKAELRRCLPEVLLR